VADGASDKHTENMMDNNILFVSTILFSKYYLMNKMMDTNKLVKLWKKIFFSENILMD